ncbi:MAG: ankyrin repeat-containing protein [Clostridiaceae bacterium]|jgi:uncharacterized protein YegP (UPF0339 family)|nr:ankyrin repeat-containing protein [Clostridiaceae bacterium]
MRKKIIAITVIFIVIIFIYHIIGAASNYVINKMADKGGDRINNIMIYKDTPVWELALAVRDQETEKIEKIGKSNQELLNYQEPKYGATLLLWAVGMEKYESVEALLKCGSNPNIASTKDGETPLFLAAGYSWIDNNYKTDPKYVKILLSYGADPNKNYVGHAHDILEKGTSPLMNSIGCGLEKTKALVEGGADINYKTKSGASAAIESLNHVGPNTKSEEIKYAYYLIVEKKAKVNEPYYRGENVTMPGDNPEDKFYPVDILRNWIIELSSEGYKKKMEIVDEFERQGVDYWKTKIPQDRLEQIKKIYPDTWEEYIKKY